MGLKKAHIFSFKSQETKPVFRNPRMLKARELLKSLIGFCILVGL